MNPAHPILRSAVARKFLLLIVACALLPIGGLAYLSVREVYGSLEDQAHQRLRHASKNVGMSVFNGFHSLQKEMKVLLAVRQGEADPSSAIDPGLPGADLPDRSLRAAGSYEKGGGCRILFGPECPPPPASDSVRRHLASGRPVVYRRTQEGGPSRIFLAFSTRGGTGGQALLVGEINADYLWDLARIAVPDRMDIDILGEEGLPLFGTRPAPMTMVRRVRDALERSSSGRVRWADAGKSFYGDYWSVFLKGSFESGNWTVVASLPEEEVFGPVREFTRVLVLLLLLTGIIVLLLAVVQIRRNLAPLNRLIEGTGRIRQGEFANRVDIGSGDEFEELGRSFNAMSEQLERQFRAMKETNLRMEREIAERKLAEGEKALLGMAVEQVAESILISDAGGTILYANAAFERTSRFRRDEVVGKPIEMVAKAVVEAAPFREIRRAWLKGEVWSGRILGATRDGRRLEEEMILSPVRDGDGRIVNYVVSKRDVTTEMVLEEQLRHSQKMEAVGKLTGGIAHDFNNLLTAVIGYSELALAKLDGDGRVRKEIEGIHDAGERASQLVRQLLTFSRKQVTEPKVVDLNAVLSGIDMMLHRLIPENILVRAKPGKGLWSVRVDPGQIELAIVNLAVNARDAMPDGGTLSIETANLDACGVSGCRHPVGGSGKFVVLKVTDTGCGIGETIRSRIFEPFFTTKEPGKGTGLGLSTVYGIVRQAGGSIFVDSEPGKGAAFTVYLPAAEDLRDVGEMREREQGAEHGGTETILLAEDEPLVRELALTILVSRGYRVLQARDGRETLEVGTAHRGPIHLLLTDMVMPHMGGKEAATLLRVVRPGIPVLFMSGYLDDATLARENPGPGFAFLQKPFRPEMLARKVRELLDGSATSEHRDFPRGRNGGCRGEDGTEAGANRSDLSGGM